MADSSNITKISYVQKHSTTYTVHCYLKQALDQSTLTLNPSAVNVALMEFCLKSISLRVSSREQHNNNLSSVTIMKCKLRQSFYVNSMKSSVR